MKYNLATMDEADLLQVIMVIDAQMQEHYVDRTGIEGRLKQIKKDKEKGRLLRVLEESGLTPDEVVSILSATPPTASPVPSKSNTPRGVTIVNVTESQRRVIDANMKREKSRKEDKLQALMDKYNKKIQ